MNDDEARTWVHILEVPWNRCATLCGVWCSSWGGPEGTSPPALTDPALDQPKPERICPACWAQLLEDRRIGFDRRPKHIGSDGQPIAMMT